MTYRLFVDEIPGLAAHVIDPWDPDVRPWLEQEGLTPDEYESSDHIMLDETGAQMIRSFVIAKGLHHMYLPVLR